MKRKNFLLMLMLFGASSLCYAQTKYSIEYDKSGNVLKRKKLETLYSYFKGDEYVVEVHDNPTKGPLHIIIKEGRPNRIINADIRILIYPATGGGQITYDRTFGSGDCYVDLSNYATGVYVVTVLVTIDRQQYTNVIKIIKE